MTELEARTREWIDGDPDPKTRAELTSLLGAEDFDELAERMAGTLEFGTAGIRGAVEAGSNRMNRAVVIRTTAGLCAHLDTIGGDNRLVVIGMDARPSSATFLEDTIGVLLAAGFDVAYFTEPTPTPIVAYAALRENAVSAIVITASHNPPADNGYKVYASNGAQIVSPTDVEIAAEIAKVGPSNKVPRAAVPFEHPNGRVLGADIFEDYLHAVASQLPPLTGDRSLSIVYSAMHGVGGASVVAALNRFGFANVHPVARQFEPDGTFPTVSFPNPEEPGAMDMSHELAGSIDADLVMANDPDADRLAVSVPFPGGVWKALTGNQIGCLLAEFLLSSTDELDGPVINSIVSSPLLGRIADRHGVTFTQTLTGFKWICNASMDLIEKGEGPLIMGYEEALGYSIGDTVRDKDGISAAVAFATLAAVAAGDGKTVIDKLGELYETYGVWTSAQVSIRREGAQGQEEIARAMRALREATPGSVNGVAVTGIRDFSTGEDTRPRYLGRTNLIELDLGEVGRVLARPSGTEPKLKVYVDLTGPYPEDGDWIGAEQALATDAAAVGEALATWLTDRMGS